MPSGKGSQPQHLEALARANASKAARARLRRRIAAREVDLSEVIEHPPAGLETMPLKDVLIAQRGWGPDRAMRVLNAIGIEARRPLSALSEAERTKLLEAVVLGFRAPREQPTSDSAQASWDQLIEVTTRREALSREVAHLTVRRDRLIRDLSRAGVSRRSVADAASLTVGRVQQIVDRG